MYHDAQETVKHFTGHIINLYYEVKNKIENTTAVVQLQTNMCVNSCVVFMGPFECLDKCPTCDEACYEENKKTWKPATTTTLHPSIGATIAGYVVYTGGC